MHCSLAFGGRFFWETRFCLGGIISFQEPFAGFARRTLEVLYMHLYIIGTDERGSIAVTARHLFLLRATLQSLAHSALGLFWLDRVCGCCSGTYVCVRWEVVSVGLDCEF